MSNANLFLSPNIQSEHRHILELVCPPTPRASRSTLQLENNFAPLPFDCKGQKRSSILLSQGLRPRPAFGTSLLSRQASVDQDREGCDSEEDASADDAIIESNANKSDSVGIEPSVAEKASEPVRRGSLADLLDDMLRVSHYNSAA